MFISVDPLFSQTMEAYVYGAANPVTYSDPSGLCTWDRYNCDGVDLGTPTEVGGGGGGGAGIGDFVSDEIGDQLGAGFPVFATPVGGTSVVEPVVFDVVWELLTERGQLGHDALGAMARCEAMPSCIGVSVRTRASATNERVHDRFPDPPPFSAPLGLGLGIVGAVATKPVVRAAAGPAGWGLAVWETVDWLAGDGADFDVTVTTEVLFIGEYGQIIDREVSSDQSMGLTDFVAEAVVAVSDGAGVVWGR